MVIIHLQTFRSCGCTALSDGRVAGKAAITTGWRLGKSEVLRSLRHYMRAQSQGHHTVDCLEGRGVERGSAG